jgi:anaerobic dimethyl sulfoxide reductase subunit C (anchor subunit)
MGVDIRITLTAFTVLAPAGAVAFLLLAVLIIRQREREAWVERLEHWLVMPLAVCMAGLIASATHLGTPGNALYVFSGWGRSPLSNEVTSALGFLVVAGVYWLASFSGRVPFALSRLWLGVSCGTALWLVANISVVYAIPTIPTWNSGLVPPGLWALAFATGPPVTLATLALARRTGVALPVGSSVGPSTALPAGPATGPSAALPTGPATGSSAALPAALPPQPWYDRILLGCSACALLAALVILGVQNAELEQVRNAFGTAAELVPWNGWAIAGLGLLGTLALVALAAFILRGKAVPLPTAFGAVALMFVGAALVRIAFYSLHMTL